MRPSEKLQLYRLMLNWDKQATASSPERKRLGRFESATLGSLVAAAPNTAAMLATLPAIGNNRDFTGGKLLPFLEEYMKKNNIGYHIMPPSRATDFNPAAFINPQIYKRFQERAAKASDSPMGIWRKLRFEAINQAMGMGPEGIPSGGKVVSKYSKKAINPHVLAHELGHSQQKFVGSRLGSGLYRMGTIAPVLGSYGVLRSKDDRSANRMAHASALSALPMLGFELDASRRGAKLIGQAGGKLGAKARAFVGVPTYAALAASPYVANWYRKLRTKER